MHENSSSSIVTAVQCVSPASTSILDAKTLEKAERVKREQKELIIKRSTLSESSRKSASRGLTITATDGSMECQHSAQGLPVTPPLSTTSQEHAKSIADLKSPSIANRRRSRPMALDIEAIQRDRQYTGPFSANPLLKRKRENELPEVVEFPSEDEHKLRPDTSSVSKSKTGSIKKQAKVESNSSPSPLRDAPATGNLPPINRLPRLPQLPHLMYAPFTAAGISRVHPPVIPSPKHNTPSSFSFSFHEAPLSRAEINEEPVSPKTVATGLNSRHNKKDKFLQLCGQIWDLLE